VCHVCCFLGEVISSLEVPSEKMYFPTYVKHEQQPAVPCCSRIPIPSYENLHCQRRALHR